MIHLTLHLEPLAPGETQICSESSRVSSFAVNEDGTPFTSNPSLWFGLKCKQAFDESWYSINDPEEPEEPKAAPAATVMPTIPTVPEPILQIKQPASSEALEEHTAGQLSANGSNLEPRELAPSAAYPSLPSEAMPDFAQQSAKSVPAEEPIGPNDGIPSENASETYTGSARFDLKEGVAPQDEELGTLSTDEGSCHLSHTEPKPDLVALSPTRKRRLWAGYVRPEATTLLAEAERPQYAIPDGPLPTRARTLRQTPVKKTISIPSYVKEAKIAEQDGRCIYCERDFGTPVLHSGRIEILEPHSEHFKPRAASGRTSDSNIVYACHVCNLLKSDFLFDSVENVTEFLRREWTRKNYTTCPPLIPFKREIAVHVGTYN